MSNWRGMSQRFRPTPGIFGLVPSDFKCLVVIMYGRAPQMISWFISTKMYGGYIIVIKNNNGL